MPFSYEPDPAKQSHRHHYVPQFLIKQFVDDDGFLYVYNKEVGKISRQSPKGSFFEMDRNTVELGGIPMDNMEQMYKDLDDVLAVEIRNALQHQRTTPEEVASIVVLASMLKWRVPASDPEFNALKENTSLDDLKVKITIKDEQNNFDPAMMEHLLKAPIFQASKRVMLPVLPLLEPGKIEAIHENSFVFFHNSNYYPALVGDNPVLEKNSTEYNKLENFIFPLSSSATFIYKDGAKKQITNPAFFWNKDLAIFDAARKYVGCKSRAYLEGMVAMHAAMMKDGTQQKIRKVLFNAVY